MRRFAHSLCRTSVFADDLVQATCERALTRSPQYEPGTRMESWLFSIMISIWKNDLRSRATEARAFSVIYNEADTISADHTAIGKIFLSEVFTAMKELTPDQAAAITLTSIEGFSYRQAAEILEIPQGTLESRIGRGRISLGRLLDNGEINGENNSAAKTRKKSQAQPTAPITKPVTGKQT